MDWKEFIQCAVCLRPFDGSHLPVSLICGHTICTPCIQACSGSSSGSQHSSFPWSSSRSDSPAREAQSLQYDNGIENITPENHGKKVPMQGLRNYQCPLDQTVHKVPLTNLPVNSSLVHLLRLEAQNSSQENHGNVVQNPFNGNAEQRGFERDRLSPLHRCPSAPESLVLRNPASHASPRQFNPSPLSYTHSSSAMDSAGWLQNAQFGRSNSSNVQNGGFASAREQRSLDTGRMPLSLQNSQESSFSSQSRSVEYSSIPPFRAWEGQSALSHALFALESGNMMAGGEADIMDEKAAYEAALASLDQLAAVIGSLDSGAGVPSQILNKPLQRKILALLQCQIAFPEGRSKCLRAVRSVCERVVMELIIQHQNQQQLTSHLWSAVRARGCQFLGPAMQEEVLKLVLLALETGSALSRKVLVMFIVQKLKPQYSQASKTSVGHVVQLLYRASCFKVSKRDGDSSLMELKEEFRNYDALRKEHDAQIIQIAQEAGLRIAPEQWSALLYGDHLHKSHMQSIIDKLQSAQFFAQSVQELLIAVQRSGDTGNLCRLRGPLDQVAGLALDNPNQNGEEKKKDAPSMQLTAISIHSAVQVVTAFLAFMGNAMIRREMMSAARIRSLNTPISGLGTPTSENGKMIQPLALQAHLSTVHPAFVHPQIAAHRALSATRSLPHSHAALQSQNSLPLFAPFPHSQTHFHMPSGENRPPLADLAYQTHGGVAMSNQSRHPLTRMTGVPDFARSVPDAQFRLARNDGGGMDGMGPSRMLGRTISRQVSVPGSGLDTFNSQMQNSAALYGKSALADDHSGRTSSLEDDFYSAQLRLHPVSGASDFDGFHRNSRPLQGSLSSPFTSAWPTESYRNPENNNMMFHVGDKNSPPEGKLGSSYDGPSSFMPDYSQRPPPGLNSLLNSRRLPSSSGSLLDEFARWRDDASTSQGMHRISSLSSDLGNMRLSRSAVFHDEYSNPSALDFPYPSLATKQTSFAPPSSSAHSASSHSGPHSETSASLANRFQGVSNGELDGHDENGHWAASCLFSLSDDDPSVDA